MKQLERGPDAFEAALRAERPEISRDFAAQLDAWAAEGFPSVSELDGQRGPQPGGPTLERLRSGWRRFRSRPLLPALTAAATIVTALIIAVGVSSTAVDDQRDIPQSLEPISGGDAASEAPDQDSIEIAPDEPGIVAPEPLPPVPPIGGQDREKLNPGQERIQESTVTTTLSTEPGDLADVADGVIEVTERYDGIVVSSNVNTSEDGGRASFALKIPAQNLQAFLADLSDLADVTARSEDTIDITAPFVSAEERFDEAKAEVDSLIAELAEADASDERAAVKAELSVARGTLAAVRTELAQLKQRADFATVSVTVDGNGDVDGDGSSIGDSADDALSVLEDIAGAALIALAVILPAAAIIAAIAWATSRIRRRRRESALD